MSVQVTEAMLEAGYKWAEEQSSMVDFMGEAEVKKLLADAFVLMYNMGYPGCIPVKQTLTPDDSEAKVT